MINIGTLLFIFIYFSTLLKSHRIKSLFIDWLLISIMTEIFIERGYFIQIGSQQVAYRSISEILLFLFSIYIAFTNDLKLTTKRIYDYLCLVFVLLIGWFFLIISPTKATGANFDVSWESILVDKVSRQPIRFTNSMITEIVSIFMYLWISFVCCGYLQTSDEENLLNKFLHYCPIFLMIDMVEVICKYIFHSNLYTFLSDLILGKSISTQEGLINRGNGYALWGLTKEASHYSFFLSILLILYFAKLSLDKQNKLKTRTTTKIFIFLIILCFAFSMSFSTLFYAICILILLFCIYTEKKGNSLFKLCIITILVIVFIVATIRLLPTIANNVPIGGFWGRRIHSAAEEVKNISNGTWLSATTALEWSNRVRLGSTYETIKLLKYRPLIGLGLASVTAHSSLAMLLCGCGIIGTYFYIKIMFSAKRDDNLRINTSIYLSCIFIFLLMNLLNSLGLRPFYELWTILLSYAIRFISVSSNNRSSNNHHKLNDGGT